MEVTPLSNPVDAVAPTAVERRKNVHPLAGIAVMFVLVGAMFMPWGTVPVTTPVRTGGSLTFDAWHGTFSFLGLDVPMWLVSLLVGAAVLLSAFGFASSSASPHWISLVLLLAAFVACAWPTLLLASSPDGAVGFGSVLAGIVTAAYLVYVLSRRYSLVKRPA